MATFCLSIFKLIKYTIIFVCLFENLSGSTLRCVFSMLLGSCGILLWYSKMIPYRPRAERAPELVSDIFVPIYGSISFYKSRGFLLPFYYLEKL